MNKKLILAVIPLLVLGGVYKFVLAKPKAEAKPKIEGTVYVLGKEFLVNLADGRFAKMSVALVLDPKDESTAAGGEEGGATPPEGYGAMAQEGVVRSIVTDVVTDAQDRDLIGRRGRAKLQKEILARIHDETDVHVDEVVFTDVTVQ
jgi:flagellar basal body-associated protein FliL